jgi:coenzyme F420-0:L-glutamate ligase / coenzyme F420-1:gamma-L-glutamate ligase
MQANLPDGTLSDMLTAVALEGLPEIAPGDDLSELITAAVSRTPEARALTNSDVLVIAHKAISKSEGRIRELAEVTPSGRAIEIAEALDKDPRHVQVVLDESRDIIRATRGVLICVTHHGFVCANAGVDASNASAPGTVITLPTDPDGSARTLRARLKELTGATPAILITDSFGRAWRHGQTDVAIGCAGLQPLEDWRGRRDAAGREMRATWIAVADQLAGAADLARAKDGRQPAVLVRGAERHITSADGPGAAALLRPAAEDLFR